MIHLLLWYWGRRGGGAQHTLNLARALARRPDIRLGLSLADRLDALETFRALDADLEVVRTFRGAPGALAGLARLPSLRRGLVAQARRMRADLVLSAMNHVWTPFVAPALPRAGIAYVPSVHDARPHPGDPSLLWDWRLRQELEAARAAVVFSEAVEREVAALRPGLPVLRLPLGAAVEVSSEVCSGPEAGQFLFFGRLRAYKGLDLLRDAFRLLRERHPEATLRVVGEGDAEACAPGLSALPGVTVEPRWVADAEIPALLRRAWAVVLPYREASQSGVLSQALALGVPVVATPVGGLAEQFGGEAAPGVVADMAEAPALAAAMARLLEPGARDGFSRAALAAGAGLRDWDGQAAMLVEGLRRLGFGRAEA
ncbi:glycosyltransferase family 4 protein [Roseomonas gilardii subsp. gilardii]|uniref:glycosyltransferase family 4 protein n=1 Tax=Roseomonas gilardii TaxID=257708 RepID=UPI001FFB4DD8|nr:glycosyltransferase family 4 protein [Roseomonas gilardii]UPG73583.1 glycosyltransferase family 4 protein [Roseomonas gilardii subsp. gilardii]